MTAPTVSPDRRIAKLVATARHEFDLRLAAALPAPADAQDLVASAMRYGALAPGKRIRPLLLMLAGRSLRQRKSKLLDAACAVEMVHAASLFLDDLPCMDNAHQRRGRPTVHVRYGEDVALLAAISLLSQAYRLLATSPGLPARSRTRLIDVLAEAVGPHGLVKGQYRDLRESASARKVQDIASTNQLKTGSLFSAAFAMAGIIAGAPPQTQEALRMCADEIGQAFQLRDDLQDTAGSTATGKDAHQDEGKFTLVALFGSNLAELRLRAHVDLAVGHLTTAFPHDTTLVHVVREIARLPERAPGAPAAAPPKTRAPAGVALAVQRAQ